MKVHLVFIGNKFIYNTPLKEYILRVIEKELGFVATLHYFKKSDNSLFLYLEKVITSHAKVVVVSSKSNFATIGKVLSTVVEDNQVLKEGMLVPSKVEKFTQRSYLLIHENTEVNVIQIGEGQKMPPLFLQHNDDISTFHLFKEDEQTLRTLLDPIAQTYNVMFDITTIVEGWLRVDIEVSKFGERDNFLQAAKKLFSKQLIVTKELVPYIIERLAQKNKKVSFAESCTGGLLSYFFTKHNGASVVLDGSLVTYSNALKENWLAVDEKILHEFGAVSAEVVAEMSEGALSVSGADYALAVSGIAGDGGGTEAKPVGTVFVGVRDPKTHHEEHCLFYGDRNYVQQQSALYALKMLVLSDVETFF